MDIYHIWCDLKSGVSDMAFVEAVEGYLGHLKEQGSLSDFRIMRRKLGLAPADSAEFHVMMEFENLAALDTAFEEVSTRTDPVESLHHSVNSLVSSLSFGLYRDFPDEQRQVGEEKF